MANDPEQDVTILDAAQAHYARGETAALLKRWDEALQAFEAAIAAQPDYPEAWNYHGAVLHELGEDHDALDSFAEALRLRPNYPDAHSNRGISLRLLDRPEEAIAAADSALACDPAFWVAYTTRGNALRAVGRIEEALANYEQAIAAYPGNASARFNRSVCRLLLGDFERGWPEYEWRWKVAAQQEKRRVFEQPLWLGEEPIAGKTIMLHREQGLGDIIQFCRYAPLVAELGATVLLGTAPSMHGLLTSLAGVSMIVSSAEAIPRFDLQCPMLSLPLAFRTRIDTIPATVPYLAAPAVHRKKWRERLGPRQGGPRNGVRIGLAWSGNPVHGGDRGRSLTLEMAARLVPNGMTIHCLQRELRPRDVPALAMFPGLVFYGSELVDFSDTAALIAEMDLVISVDTAVLHLAGALGAPCWGLLPLGCDWRWLTERNDSPWYPTMRLFRQHIAGDWDTVIAAVRAEVERFCQGGAALS